MSAKPNTANSRPTGWIKTGRAALAAMEEEQKRAEDRQNKAWMPYRLWLPKGGETEVIILDEAFIADEAGVGGAFIREHNLKGPDGKWGLFESCCADFAPCALCDKAGTEGYGASQAVVLLTVLELREWTNKKTGETHQYSRKLLPIKLGQKGLWLDLQSRAIKAQGSMRGMYLVLRRKNDDNSVATGEPTMLENNSLFDLIPEDELVKEYGHAAVKNREGKVVKEANADLYPFDYATLFPQPDPDDLARRFGGRVLPGSRRSVAQEWSDEQEAGDAAADAAAEEPAAPPVSRRRGAAAPAPEPQSQGPARRRGAAPAPEPAPEPPARRRGAAGAQGAKSAAW